MQNENILCAEAKLYGYTFEIRMGSVLQLEVDTIVNAANENLKNLGGLAGQIIESGGKVIQDECDELVKKKGPLREGEARHTTGGTLNFKKIIHTAGPKSNGSGSFYERQKLFNAIIGSMEIASDLGYTSIGIPGISCGIFGFPVEIAAVCHVEAFFHWVNKRDKTSLRKIVVSLFTLNELTCFLDAFKEKMPYFQYARYKGTPIEQASFFAEICVICFGKGNLMGICNCGKCCNFCIMSSKSFCPGCTKPLDEDMIQRIAQFILCKECKQFKSKEFEKACICEQLCNSCATEPFCKFCSGKLR